MTDQPSRSAACICGALLSIDDKPRPCPIHGWTVEPQPDTAARMFSRREVWFVEHLAWLVPRPLRTLRPFRRYYWQKDQLDRITAEATAWRKRLGLDDA